MAGGTRPSQGQHGRQGGGVPHVLRGAGDRGGGRCQPTGPVSRPPFRPGLEVAAWVGDSGRGLVGGALRPGAQSGGWATTKLVRVVSMRKRLCPACCSACQAAQSSAAAWSSKPPAVALHPGIVHAASTLGAGACSSGTTTPKRTLTRSRQEWSTSSVSRVFG